MCAMASALVLLQTFIVGALSFCCVVLQCHLALSFCCVALQLHFIFMVVNWLFVAGETNPLSWAYQLYVFFGSLFQFACPHCILSLSVDQI